MQQLYYTSVANWCQFLIGPKNPQVWNSVLKVPDTTLQAHFFPTILKFVYGLLHNVLTIKMNELVKFGILPPRRVGSSVTTFTAYAH